MGVINCPVIIKDWEGNYVNDTDVTVKLQLYLTDDYTVIGNPYFDNNASEKEFTVQNGDTINVYYNGTLSTGQGGIYLEKCPNYDLSIDYDEDEDETYQFGILLAGSGGDISEGETNIYITLYGKEVTVTFVNDYGDLSYYSETSYEGLLFYTPSYTLEDNYSFRGWNPNIPEVFPGNNTTYTLQTEHITNGTWSSNDNGWRYFDKDDSGSPVISSEEIDIPEGKTGTIYLKADCETEFDGIFLTKDPNDDTVDDIFDDNNVGKSISYFRNYFYNSSAYATGDDDNTTISNVSEGTYFIVAVWDSNGKEYDNWVAYKLVYSGSTGVSTNNMGVTYGSTSTRTISGNTGTITISSSNTSVATASVSGSTITVTAVGNIGTSCTITVSAAATFSTAAATSIFNVTITAPTVTVTFNANGGSGGTSSTSITYGTTAGNYPSITLPSRTGYTFAGYYSASSGGTQYYNSAGNSVRTWDKLSATTLYAQWTAKSYTLTFNPMGGTLCSSSAGHNNWDSNNGSTNNSSVTVTYNSGNYCGMGVASKTGYTFNGWYTSSSGGTQVYYADGSCVPGTSYWDSGNGWIYDGNVTLYAQWEVNYVSLSVSGVTAYTLTLTAGGYGGTIPSYTSTATTTSQTLSVPYGTKYTCTWASGTDTGTGSWTITWDGQSGTPSPSTSTISTSRTRSASQPNVTTATAITSTTTLSNSWESWGSWKSKTVGTLATATRVRYSLVGWYTGTGGSGTKITTSTTVNANVTYYAYWSANKVTIPTAKSTTSNITLTYSGSSQTGINNYNSSYMTYTGSISGTNAGSYSATFTIGSNYMWSDGTTTDKTVSWYIGKISQPSLTISATKTTIYNTSGYNTSTVAGGGAKESATFTYSSGNTSKATVNSSTGVVTYVSAGSSIITATTSETTNYKATSITITITCTADTPKSITINLGSSEINYDSSTTISATVTWDSGSTTTLTDKSYFSSSDTSIVTIL